MTNAERLVDKLLEARRKPKKAKPAAPVAPAQPPEPSEEEMAEIVQGAMEYGHYHKLLGLAQKYDISISGKVERRDHHYVHERTTSFTLYVEFTQEMPPEVEEWCNTVANQVEAEIGEKIVDINHKIYRALEAEWDSRLKDDYIADEIVANERTFDETGEEDGDIPFQQLDDDAKQKAIEKWRQAAYEDPDNFWSEYIIEEWTSELEKMGFGYGQIEKWSHGKQVQKADPEINWSGFSSQGDGASFTTNHFDFTKWVEYWTTHQEMQPGPMADVHESQDVDDEITKMIRVNAFEDYGQVLQHDPMHQSSNNVHYSDRAMASDTKAWVDLDLWVTPGKDRDGVVVQLRATGTDMVPSEPEDVKVGIRELRVNGGVERRVRFFVPHDVKGDFLARLSDYWDNVKGRINQRKGGHMLVHPQKLVNSIAYTLSRMGSIWKAELKDRYAAHIKDAVDAMIRENPEEFERARQRVAGRRPAQEAEEDDMQSITQNALATDFPFETFMTDITQRFMSGTKQYSWKEGNGQFVVTLYVTTYSLELKDQPWSVDLRVKCNELGTHWMINLQISELSEKANLGPQIAELVPKLRDILVKSEIARLNARRSKEFLDIVAGAFNRAFRTAAVFEEY